MAKRAHKSGKHEDEGLPMTSMIDVVFQLLVFFVFTIKPEDLIAHLDVFRPSPDPRAKPPMEKPDDMIAIGVFFDGVTLGEKPVSYQTLEETLVKLASYSTTQTILIKCAPDSPHERLVKVLDLCAKADLRNLSVLSL